ncbi:hypothetical protein CF326_g7674 [Tilletia indica]|nr:hypothetical protein CF326_g7674 [Tilletia indica]
MDGHPARPLPVLTGQHNTIVLNRLILKEYMPATISATGLVDINMLAIELGRGGAGDVSMRAASVAAAPRARTVNVGDSVTYTLTIKSAEQGEIMPQRQARHQAGEQEADITRHLISLQAGQNIETAVPDSCRVPLQSADSKLISTDLLLFLKVSSKFY